MMTTDIIGNIHGVSRRTVKAAHAMDPCSKLWVNWRYVSKFIDLCQNNFLNWNDKILSIKIMSMTIFFKSYSFFFFFFGRLGKYVLELRDNADPVYWINVFECCGSPPIFRPVDFTQMYWINVFECCGSRPIFRPVEFTQIFLESLLTF
jgi:hypothetical protein